MYFQQISISEEEKTYSIDLRPFMNPSPYTVLHVSVFVFINFNVLISIMFQSSSLPRMFRLFRALGLRHLPIVNDTNEVGLRKVSKCNV